MGSAQDIVEFAGSMRSRLAPLADGGMLEYAFQLNGTGTSMASWLSDDLVGGALRAASDLLTKEVIDLTILRDRLPPTVQGGPFFAKRVEESKRGFPLFLGVFAGIIALCFLMLCFMAIRSCIRCCNCCRRKRSAKHADENLLIRKRARKNSRSCFAFWLAVVWLLMALLLASAVCYIVVSRSVIDAMFSKANTPRSYITPLAPDFKPDPKNYDLLDDKLSDAYYKTISVNYLEGREVSLPDMVKDALLELRAFIKETLISSRVLLDFLIANLRSVMDKGITGFVVDLKAMLNRELGLNTLRTGHSRLLIDSRAIEAFVKQMRKGLGVQYENGVLALRDTVKDINKKVNTKATTFCTVEPLADCTKVRTVSATMTNNFDPAKFSQGPDGIYQFYDEVFTKLRVGMELTEKSLETTDNTVFAQIDGLVKKQVPLEAMVKTINDAWNDMVVKTLVNLDKQLVQLTPTAEKASDYVTPVGSAVVIVICIGIIITLTFSLAILLAYTVTTCRTGCDGERSLKAQFREHNMWRGLLHMTPNLVFFSFIFLSIGFVLTLVTSLAITDACPYGVYAQHANMSEVLLEQTMFKDFASFLHPLTSSNIGQLFSTKPPSGTLKAALVQCHPSIYASAKDRQGLVSLLGMTNFIDITKLAQTDMVKGIIASGKEQIIKTTKELKPESLVPKNTQEDVADLIVIMKVYDEADESGTIKELEKAVLDPMSLDEYVKLLTDFVNEANRKNPTLAALADMKTPLEELKAEQAKAADLERKRVELLKGFRLMAGKKNFRAELRQFLDALNEVVKFLKLEDAKLQEVFAAYEKDVAKLLKELVSGLKPGLDSTVQRIVPCSRLYLAAKGALDGFCDPSNGLMHSFHALALFTGIFYSANVLFLFVILLFRRKFEFATKKTSSSTPTEFAGDTLPTTNTTTTHSTVNYSRRIFPSALKEDTYAMQTLGTGIEGPTTRHVFRRDVGEVYATTNPTVAPEPTAPLFSQIN